MSRYGTHNTVDNQLCNPQQKDWQQRREQARNQPEDHNRWAGVPHDFEHGRNIAKRRDALTPSLPHAISLHHAVILTLLIVIDAKQTKRHRGWQDRPYFIALWNK